MRIAYPRWSHVLAAGLLLAGCKSNKDSEPAPKAQKTQATAPAQKAQATTAAPKPAGPTPGTPVRNLKPAEQLAVAFRAVYGSSSEQPLTLEHEEKTYEIRPTALEWIGDTAVLLTSAEDTAGCHACSGAMGIHYLEPQGTGLAVKGSWPFLIVGSSNGSPPGDWKIRRDLGRNPFLTTEGGFTGQGQICASVRLTELAPGRPIPRGRFFTHYDNEGSASEGDAATNWTGSIAQPVPDQSFDVVYTGSDNFTEHYQRQGEEYRREGESHFEGYCE